LSQSSQPKYIVIEQKILHLLLKHKKVIEEFLENRITSDYFTDRHQHIVSCIFQEYLDNESSYPRLLTRETYQFCLQQKYGKSGQVLTGLKIFDTCIYKVQASPNDLGTLKIELINGYAARCSQKALDDYEKKIKTKGAFLATQELADELNQVSVVGNRNRSVFMTVPEAKEDYLMIQKEKRENPGKLIRCGINEFDTAMVGGLAPQTLTMVVGDTGVGKCLKYDAPIWLDNGARITVEQAYQTYCNNEHMRILSLCDKTLKIYPQTVSEIIDNGIKKCYKIKTSMGFEVEITDNHPVLMPTGYKALKDISAGDYIGVARHLTFGNLFVSEDLAFWLGLLYAEGGTSGGGKHNYSITNCDKEIIKKFSKSTKILGGRIKQIRCHNKPVKGNYHFLGSAIRKVVEKYGLKGKKAINKSIYPDIFRWDKKSLSIFLGAYFSGDGCVEISKKRVIISCASSSYDLICGIRDLLLKFGLIFRLRHRRVKYKNEQRNSWELCVSDRDSILMFDKNIKLIGHKSKRMTKAVRMCQNIPKEVWPLLDRKYSYYKTNCYECRKKLNTRIPKYKYKGDVGHAGRRYQGMQRSLLQKIASNCLENDEEINNFAKSDIIWDKVKSVEFVGRHKTYDIAMPKDHNFVTGNIITHNTNVMLSMGLNIVKDGKHNVLFVSLEMDRFRLIDRIISNLSDMDFGKVCEPHTMNDDEFKALGDSFDQWNDMKGKFAILDSPDRITVSVLKREIELRSMVFQPDVVFVDYIGIVKPELRYKDRQDIELGEISKELRFLGKKYGFAVVSACQLNREAIRRMRKKKDNLAGSEDLRGSGELSNDSDFIFALFATDIENMVKAQTIKSRYGESHKSYSLCFYGKFCKVCSYNTVNMNLQDKDDMLNVQNNNSGGDDVLTTEGIDLDEE